MELSFSIRPITAQSRFSVESEMSLFSASDFCNRSQIASEFLDGDSSFGVSVLFSVSLLKIKGSIPPCLMPADSPASVRPKSFEQAHAGGSPFVVCLPSKDRVLQIRAPHDCHLRANEVKVSYTPVVFKQKLR